MQAWQEFRALIIDHDTAMSNLILEFLKNPSLTLDKCYKLLRSCTACSSILNLLVEFSAWHPDVSSMFAITCRQTLILLIKFAFCTCERSICSFLRILSQPAFIFDHLVHLHFYPKIQWYARTLFARHRLCKQTVTHMLGLFFLQAADL